MLLRPYQSRAIDGVHSELRSGKMAPCVVAPTGSGKTVMALQLAADFGGCLFIVHTRELLAQSARRFRDQGWPVNVISPGHYSVSGARVHVATVHSLNKRGAYPDVPLVITDEHHHYVPDNSWASFLRHYQHVPRVGFTATPQRQDGKPLGDTSDALVVAAQYSELIDEGFLVPCRVLQPPETLGSDLAMDPVEAVNRYAEGQTFLFASSVEKAREYAERLESAACVDSKMPAQDRSRAVKLFTAGQLRVLTNYNVLTEGVDVPAAITCVLAGSSRHVSTFLQQCGRVLRSAPGKTEARIVDLVGATHLHGFPTMDRVYTLDGKGITASKAPPLRNCLACGTTLPAALMQCTACGYQFERRDPRIPRIFNLELQEVFAGKDTPDDAKRSEYQRLRAIQRQRGFALGWVVREYKKLFSVNPVLHDATEPEREEELRRLMAIARAKRFKQGWVAHRFKAMFGVWPRRAA